MYLELKMHLKYRHLNNEFAPKPIHLELEGWSGAPTEHRKEQKIQPYMCKPFVDANTYGIEICYPFNTEITVSKNNGIIQIIAEDDWKKDTEIVQKIGIPVGCLGEKHFSMNTCLDIMVDEKYVLRIENHPRFYSEDNVACVISGHLETNWWSSLFFIVFNSPREGQVLRFKKGDKICQVFPVLNEKITIEEMSTDLKNNRRWQAATFANRRSIIARGYKDNQHNYFDNLYKKLSKYVQLYGLVQLKLLVNKLSMKVENYVKLKLKLFK